MNMYTASSCCIAFGFRFSKSSYKFLQKRNIFVFKNRRYQFAFLTVNPCNAYIPLEFPLSALCPKLTKCNNRFCLLYICICLFRNSLRLFIAAFSLVMLFISTSTPMSVFSFPQSEFLFSRSLYFLRFLGCLPFL